MEILCVCGGGGGAVAGKPHLHIQSAKVYQFQFCPKVLGGGGGGGGGSWVPTWMRHRMNHAHFPSWGKVTPKL